jgi:SNF2 family DNA or RNA helicase
MLEGIADIDRLDDHQKVNVATMTLPGLSGLCVFDEQGAGKTVTLIYCFDLLAHRDEIDIALVIAPKSMVPEWPEDLRRFKGDLYKCAVVSGSRNEKLRTINSDADIFITNYETAVSMEQELAAMLRRHNGRAVVAVDESFFVKNLDAKRTRAIRRLREYCSRAYVLCGTPAPNSPHDLVQQFNIVDFGMTFAGVDIPDDREAAFPIVQKAIEERGLYVRHLKCEVLPELPVKRFQRIVIPLAPEQHKLYVGALNDLILDLKSTDDETFQRQILSFMAKRIALLQICSNPASLVKRYTETPAKLMALDEILEEITGRRNEKVVVWSFYTASLNALIDRYARFNPVRYDGLVTDIAERREAIRRFQEDDETMLFVANPAAAGAGITLHRARYAIYESMSNQAAHYLQSVDRIHRRGQTRDVEYLILLCDKTIEIEEYERLIDKEQSGQELLGDRVEEPVTRESMLSEALNAIRLIGEGP